MSKELDRLEHLRLGIQYINQDKSPAFISHYEEDINIIETALKRNEYLERENFELSEQVSVYATYKGEEEKKLKALDVIKNCIVGEFELKDNCDTDNAFNSPYRFRIYIDDITFNEWVLKNKEEYNTLKEALKYEQ